MNRRKQNGPVASEGQNRRPWESKDIRCKTGFCGMLEAGISKGTIQNLNPERITGVMMKVKGGY